MKQYLFLLTVLLLAGCSLLDSSGDKPNKVTFTVDQKSYALGQTIMATLANDSNNPLTYNLCMTQLQQHRNGEWTNVAPSAACNAIAMVLKPGAKESYRLDPGKLIEASEGRYRLITDVGIREESKDLTTAAFRLSATIQQ